MNFLIVITIAVGLGAIITIIGVNYSVENQATWLIVIGLVFDILGALWIIGPIRHSRRFAKKLFKILTEIKENMDKREKEGYEISPLSNSEEINRLVKNDYDRQSNELEDYPKLMVGIGFLVLGFLLQIIGNWFLNPPI